MAKRRPSGDGMVRKREDGRWEGRIVVGHKQNGEPIFRYVLAKTQKELLDKLHRDLEAFQDVELTEDSRMTLGEWLDRWMEDYGAATLRPNTLRSYEQFIRCYIKPYLGDKIVSRVTRMDIQKLYRKLKHEGRVREHPEHGHELSDTMVLRIHAMLHRCLKDAEAAHVIARNPTDGAVVPKANHRPKQILTKVIAAAVVSGVDVVSDGDEAHTVGREHPAQIAACFNILAPQAGEVFHDHAVDVAIGDVLHHFLERGTVKNNTAVTIVNFFGHNLNIRVALHKVFNELALIGNAVALAGAVICVRQTNISRCFEFRHEKALLSPGLLPHEKSGHQVY